MQQGATLGDLTTGEYLKCMQVASMIRDRNKFQNENGETVLGMTAQSCMDCEPNPVSNGEGVPIVAQGGGTRNPPPPHLDWVRALILSYGIIASLNLPLIHHRIKIWLIVALTAARN
jgi:hypothetical protein